MELAYEVSQRFLQALLGLLSQPFYYIGIALVILQYRRQVHFERKLFNTRLHSMLDETWRTLLWGVIGGFAASLIMAAIGAALQWEALILLWAVTIVLVLFRMRFLCFVYAVGVLGVGHAIVSLLPEFAPYTADHRIVETLYSAFRRVLDLFSELHMASLFALVAVLHLLEAGMIRWQGARGSSPLFVKGKRGKIVGGYQLKGFWAVPLFLLVPVQSGSGMSGIWGSANTAAGAATSGGATASISLPWQPLLGGDLWSSGWMLLAFPVVIGFTEMTRSKLPETKVRLSSGLLALYSVVLLGLAIGVELWTTPIVILVVSLFCVLVHEGLIGYSRWDESQRKPLFVHSQQGLTVLAVLPKSPADDMGIVPGEIVRKVNDAIVLSKDEMHRALQLNPAYCRLEVINLQGQSKFVQKALFAGEHHQLGILLAPDDDAMYYVEEGHDHLGAYMRSKPNGLVANDR